MCTSISLRRNDHYFGRNLDVEFTFNEKIIITPRNYHFPRVFGDQYTTKYGLIGAGIVMNKCPMYYEAVNEKGLGIAGLNFPGNIHFQEKCEGRDNLTLSEMIPWIASNCESVEEAKVLLSNANIVSNPYETGEIKCSLHFMISDKKKSIVVETAKEGLKIFDNPYDVMTNNPPFDYHLWNMHHYLNLSPKNEANRFSDKFQLINDGVGMGAYGLPGDASSTSRFVRAAFHLANISGEDTENANVSSFFHILDSVAMLKGSTLTDNGKCDITLYSCCVNADKGIYYFKTYDNNQIYSVHLHNEDLTSDELIVYDMHRPPVIEALN